jgi:hypothetical protein
MGAIEQLASASLAALFSIGMLIASHIFMEYRLNRSPTISVVEPARLLSDNVRRSISRGYNGTFNGVL